MSGWSIPAKQDKTDDVWHVVQYEAIDLKLVKNLVEKRGLDVNSVNHYDKTVLHVVVDRCRSVFHKDVGCRLLDIVNYLVEHGAAVNSQDKWGKTVLDSAVECESIDIVKYLVEHGAEVNGNGRWGITVLHSAVGYGSLEIVKCLVEHGAEVNGKGCWDKTALHRAVKCGSLDIAKYLVEHGAKVNGKDQFGKTVLHSAVEYRSLDIVKYLVEHGAEVNGKNQWVVTVLHSAVKCGSLEIVEYLVEHGAEVNGKDLSNKTVLQSAVENGSLEVVKYLVEHGAEVNGKGQWETVLHNAAECGFLDIFKYLVEHGAEVNSKGLCVKTAFHNAVEYGSLDTVKCFVEHGVEVNGVGVAGKTTLHNAVEYGSLEIVKYLVEHGAEVNGKDMLGKTVLYSAVKYGSLEIVKYLVEHGAEVNGKDKWGKTFLHNAVELGSLEIVKYLVKHGAEVNGEDLDGKTALHNAVECGSLEIVKYLVESGAEANGKDIWSETILHTAVKHRFFDIMKCLVENGADINCTDLAGRTAVELAVWLDDIELVQYLVEHGGDVHCKSQLGNETVLPCAVELRSEDIVKYFIEGVNYIDTQHKGKFDLGIDILKMAVVQNLIDFVQLLIDKDIDVRRAEKVLVEEGKKTLIEHSSELGYHEITNILKLELKKSVKHREKIQMLKTMNRKQLKKMVVPMQAFVANNKLKIGNGSNGTCVYVGVMEDGSEVAVKRMLTQGGEDTAENEKEILNLIRTEEFPFIVGYRHFFRDDTFMYLIVDLCEENLKKYIDSQSIDYLQQHGPRMIKEIITGLTFLHDRRILHRDLKPLNILVDIEGRMRLADFGISRVLKEDETTDLTDPKGTPNWMPAEVIKSIKCNKKCRFKKKSDVQVTGMIAFFILTKGKHPFGSSPDCMANIEKGNPVNLDNLDDLHARQFISWLISHQINDRPYAHEGLEHSFVKNS